MEKRIKSPVTDSYNTKILKIYSKEHFIEMYKKSINFDVSRFFTEINEILYVKCLDTGYKFFYPFSISGDELFYEDLQQFEWYYKQDKWEFEEALSQIKKSDKVLEIGAGNGAFLKRLINKKENVDAIEFNVKSLSILKKQGHHVYNQTIQKLAQTKEGYYDTVVSFQVLEHISDVKSFIKASIRVLRKGGKLIFAVPNSKAAIIKYDFNLSLNFPPHHMGHWDKISFMKLEKYFPIKCVNIAYEPLQKEQYHRYYRVIAFYIRRKFRFLGKIIDKLFLYPYYEYFIAFFGKKLKGQSMIVIYKKM